MGSNPATTWVADVRRRWPEHLVEALVALCQQREFSQLLQPEGPLKDLELRTRRINSGKATWHALDINPVVSGAVAFFPR